MKITLDANDINNAIIDHVKSQGIGADMDVSVDLMQKGRGINRYVVAEVLMTPKGTTTEKSDGSTGIFPAQSNAD